MGSKGGKVQGALSNASKSDHPELLSEKRDKRDGDDPRRSANGKGNTDERRSLEARMMSGEESAGVLKNGHNGGVSDCPRG